MMMIPSPTLRAVLTTVTQSQSEHFNFEILVFVGTCVYSGRAIAITYRVFVNQESSALPNLALTLALTLTLT